MAEATLAQGAPSSGAPTSPASAPGTNQIDPTKNVLDLVQAESKFQNSMREAESRYRDGMRDAEARLQTALREAETRRQMDLARDRDNYDRNQVDMTRMLREAEIRRQDDLSRQKDAFDKTQADMLRIQVADNAALVSTQLDKVTTVLSDRIAKLEQFRYESSGKGGGVTMVVGYLIAFASLAVAIAVAFVKFNPSGT